MLLQVREPPAEEASLWRALRAEGSPRAREALFAAYYPYARRIAARHVRRGAGDVEFNELSQLAATGLLEAIDRFDPDRGVPFRGYAGRRISGAILSGVAKLSELREQISFRNRVRAERLRSLSEGGDADLSAAAAMEALADMAIGLALGMMLDGSGMVAAENEPDRRSNAFESLAWRQAVARVVDAVAELPERQAAIIRGHYFEGVDFERLATLFGVSKGRVSQLHRAALESLRRRLSAQTFKLER